MLELTDEQVECLRKGETVRLRPAALQEEVVLMRSSDFAQWQEQLADAREQHMIAAYAKKQAAQVARENPYFGL